MGDSGPNVIRIALMMDAVHSKATQQTSGQSEQGRADREGKVEEGMQNQCHLDGRSGGL